MKWCLSVFVLNPLFALSLSAQSNADTPVSDSSRPILPALAGGVIGTGAGMIVGVVIGPQIENCGAQTSVSDMCGLGGAILGMGVLGTVGAAAGAYVGARLGDGSPSAVRTSVAAVGGIGTGLLVAMLVERLGGWDGPVFIGYGVGQGALAGLAAALWN